MSISWGRQARYKFDANGSLPAWDPPPVAAVYAITYRGDPEKPKTHTVLFFGQAGNLTIEAPELNRQVIDAWKEGGHDVSDLYVFVHPMPGSSSGARTQVQEQLVAEYRPRCNR